MFKPKLFHTLKNDNRQQFSKDLLAGLIVGVVSVFKCPVIDAAVLLTTFFLTVLIDLTVTIEIGIALAVFLFMRIMIKFSDVSVLTKDIDDDGNRELQARYSLKLLTNLRMI